VNSEFAAAKAAVHISLSYSGSTICACLVFKCRRMYVNIS